MTLNVEVNAKDPAGITAPYRLLVPRLQYEYDPADDGLAGPEPSILKRFFSRGKKPAKARPSERDDVQSNEDEEDA